jgi:hypothetical protein
MLEEQVSNDEKDRAKLSRSLKFCLVFCTLVYLVLLPFFLFGALFYAAMILDLSNATSMLVSLAMILLVFCIPLSLLVSIYLIITGYDRGERKLRFACALPLLVFGASSIIDIIQRAIFWR